MGNPELPCALLVAVVRDVSPGYFIRREELKREDIARLLSTLTEFCNHPSLSWGLLFGIWLATLSGNALKWTYSNRPDIVLLDAVVTLAAMSCFTCIENRRRVLTSSHEHLWLLLNIRNSALFIEWFEHIPPRGRTQITS